MIDYGTPFDALFAALETRLGVLVTPDDSPSQRDRIVFTRSGPPAPRPIPYRVAGERTTGRRAHPYTATCYAATDRDASALAAMLEAELDDVLGPKQGGADLEELKPEEREPVGRGYETSPGKLAGVVGGDGVAAGYACDLGVTLFTRVRSEVRPLAAVTRARVTSTPVDS
ncbi:MAG: hypothetical protein KBF21_15465 [Thermoanaerobaculia bacterium]|nr:hypothetical protein [Thermoanaerobaculia bacterium]